MPNHYEIVIIEDFSVDRDGNLVVTAILENMGKCTVQQSFWDPPEYAPARCKTIVYPEALPDDITFEGKTKDELEELVNRYQLLVCQEWTPITDSDYDQNHDDYCPGGSRLYF